MIASEDWAGRFAFGPWWFLYSGPVSSMSMTAHETVKVLVHSGSPCVYADDEQPLPGPVVVVRPRIRHEIRGEREHALVLFVEPGCAAGERLVSSNAPTLDIVGHPVVALLGSLRPHNWSRAEEAVHRILVVLDAAADTPMRWWRHRYVDTAWFGHDTRDSVGEIGRPPSRPEMPVPELLQMLSAEASMTEVAYERWLRMSHATEQLALGSSIDDAATTAGFDRARDYRRAFLDAFGLEPAAVVRTASLIR